MSHLTVSCVQSGITVCWVQPLPQWLTAAVVTVWSKQGRQGLTFLAEAIVGLLLCAARLMMLQVHYLVWFCRGRQKQQ